MEIEIFTLADFAQDNNSKLTIVGTFDSIFAKQFPVLHPSCAVACRLRFSVKETGTHNFKLRLINSSGHEIISPIQGNISVVKPTNGQYSTVNVVVNFNQLKFDKPGRFSFELYLNEEWMSGLPLFLSTAP